MYRKYSLMIALTLLCSVLFAQKFAQLELGAKAPNEKYKMKDISGKMVSLEQVKNSNGVLVIFTCNTCPFVIAWEDRYPEIQKWADANKVGMILVNSNWAKREGDDSFERMKAHAREKGYNSYYVVDEKSQLANAFGAQTTPHVFLFDGQSQLVYKGAIDDNFRNADKVEKFWLKDALYAVGKGDKLAVTSTPPKGCSIKRKLD